MIQKEINKRIEIFLCPDEFAVEIIKTENNKIISRERMPSCISSEKERKELEYSLNPFNLIK